MGFASHRRPIVMFTLLVVALVLAAVVGVVGVVGVGAATVELGKMLFFCALVLVLISAIVGIVRGRART